MGGQIWPVIFVQPALLMVSILFILSISAAGKSLKECRIDVSGCSTNMEQSLNTTMTPTVRPSPRVSAASGPVVSCVNNRPGITLAYR